MKKNYRSLLIHLPLVFILLFNLNSGAQSTNPAPYCYPKAVNMTGGTCTGTGGVSGYGFCLESVLLNTLSQTGSCYGSSNNDVYRYWSATTSLNAGGNYTMTIVTPQNSTPYLVSSGAWIDYNRNNSFEPSELIGSALGYNYSQGFVHNLMFSVPCSATAGKTRMRVRAQNGIKISGADSCAAPQGYGESWDFDITIVQPVSVKADFSAPSQAYIKTPVTFINANKAGSGYFQHAWDANNDGSWEQIGANPDYSTTGSTWTTAGTKCVKLRSKNCFGTDSTVKCISVIAPTAKPVADFTTCRRSTEIYGAISLSDLSSNGPYQWEWNIYDSITYKDDPFDPISDESSGYVTYNLGTTKNSKNPSISFYRDGNYNVELKATNGIGTSVVTKKRYYIKVLPNDRYYIGHGIYGTNSDNRIEASKGKLTDNGGESTNYSNGMGPAKKSFLIINPPSPNPVYLTFEQIRLKDNYDSIKIYDDDKMDSSKLIAVLTASNNGTYPVYKSTSNKLYFYFSSNATGADSGFIAVFSNAANYISPKQNILIGHDILFINQKSVFYNEIQNEFNNNGDKIWTVNDTVQPTYGNMDTLVYMFKYTGNHKVCLEVKSCDTSIKSCKTLLFSAGLMGNAYRDLNSDCTFDSADKGLRNIRIKLFDSSLNAWSYFLSNSRGAYNFNLPAGTYKAAIDTLNLPYTFKCASPGLDSFFRLSSSDPLKSIDFNIACKPALDMGVQSIWVNGMAFPGRYHTVMAYVDEFEKWYGLNCTSGKAGKVIIRVKGKVTFSKVETGALTPSSISGNVFTYNVSDFSAINASTAFGLVFMTDTNSRGGDKIEVSVIIETTDKDIDTTNNRMDYSYQVRNSYDPNFKEVYPVEITQGYKDWLTYTIHFQNTGTAPAYNIRLADTLDKRLDPESFQMMNYSHSVETSLINNILSFTFTDIQLPDSNSNEKASHGFVQFRIKPKLSLPKGAVIQNTAFIYFDYNEPVVTNTVTNEVYPHSILIPDTAFAAWLTAKYPACMRKGNLMDTSCSVIKNESSIDVSGKNIADLFGIQFFNSLRVLNCSDNQLKSLPDLSDSLRELTCSENQLTTLPLLSLPLWKLDCRDNELDVLPDLPSSLLLLNCSNNHLTTLPILPAGLSQLSCGYNDLDSLPALPAALVGLDADYNLLVSLPSLPSALRSLSCAFNKIIALPAMPSGLKDLYCQNNQILCFEKFSNQIEMLRIGFNRNKCLPNYVAVMDSATKTIPLCKKGDTLNNPDGCYSSLVNFIESVVDENILKVYPNPGSGVFNLSLNGNYRETDIRLEVYDVQGKRIYSSVTRDSFIQIDLSSQSAGIYLLKVNVADRMQNGYLIKE